MTIETHTVSGKRIAELASDTLHISSIDDIPDLLGNLYYQEFSRIIIHERSIIPAFFDLKTGIAGEVLQKFSNYRMRLAIVGNFEKFTSKSLRDFIRESNQGSTVNFVGSVAEALNRLSRG
ncbi:MAG: DUF4180 domain-containing protein [Tenuifilaceae bacterium]|jgi:hypothetical protein|nr:DUF4180 domain-containing protein [Tenuifilaceae bacterium]